MRYLRSLLYKLSSLVTRWFSPYGVCELLSVETIGRLEATSISDHQVVVYCEKQTYHDLRWSVETDYGKRVIYRMYSVCNPNATDAIRRACKLEVFYPIAEGLILNPVGMMDVLAGHYLELLNMKLNVG